MMATTEPKLIPDSTRMIKSNVLSKVNVYTSASVLNGIRLDNRYTPLYSKSVAINDEVSKIHHSVTKILCITTLTTAVPQYR